MRMPRLLKGHTMEPETMLRPTSMRLSMKADDKSICTMKMDADAPDIEIGAWIQIWSPNGQMCVMRVQSKTTDHVEGGYTLELEHAIGILEEMTVFGEYEPEDMGGSDGKVSASKAMEFLLGKQTEKIWEMGDCDFDDRQGWKFTNTDIYSGIQDIMGAIQQCQLEYNQTSLPWKISLKAWPTAATMEMRRNRNIGSLQITMDRSAMYTRVYPTGKSNLHIDDANGGISYIDRNTDAWGIVSQVITDSSIDDPSLLKAWAEAQLRRNAEPAITVSISGLDLSENTGESLDRIIPGRICQVPLPEYGDGRATIERVVDITWPDCIADEENITATMANEHKTIQGILNEKAKSGGAGGRKSQTSHDCALQEDEERIQEFDNSDIWINRDAIWAVSGQYDVVTDLEGNKHIRLKDGALLEVKNSGIYQTVGSIVNEQQTTLDFLDEWVDSFEGSALWTQREGITGVCGEFDVVWTTDAEGNRIKTLVIKSGGGMKIRRDNVEYGLYDDGNLTGGVIVNKINGGDGSITETQIKGDRIVIGTLNDDDLNSWAKDAKDGGGVFAKYLTVKKLSAEEITTMLANIGQAEINSIYCSEEIDAPIVQADTLKIDVDGAYSNLRLFDAVVSGNTLRLYYTDGTTQDFNKAVTGLDGVWSSGALSVTASPQGYTSTVTRLSSAFSVDGSPVQCSAGGVATSTGKYLKQGIIVQYVDSIGEGGAEILGQTGMTLNVIMNASSVYNYGERIGHSSGWADAYSECVFPRTGTSDTMTIEHPSSTENAGSSHTYTVSADNDYAYIKNAAGTTVARASNGAYTNGYQDGMEAGWIVAYAKLGFPSGIDSSRPATMTIDHPGWNYGVAASHAYTLYNSGNYVYLRNAAGADVARIEVAGGSSSVTITEVYAEKYDSGSNPNSDIYIGATASNGETGGNWLHMALSGDYVTTSYGRTVVGRVTRGTRLSLKKDTSSYDSHAQTYKWYVTLSSAAYSGTEMDVYA